MKKQFRVIPALDTEDLERACTLVKAVDDDEFIYGYKLGFSLGLTYGLPQVVHSLRSLTSRPLIYDHQKAGTDIPDTGTLFARTISNAGIDEVILFPQAGPATLQAWWQALQERELKVIVGALMTHPQYLVSEGGFISDDSVPRMYRQAAQAGVTAFVFPLTRPQQVRRIFDQAQLPTDCECYTPGFGPQKGDVEAFSFISTHYLIVGRALLSAPEPGTVLAQLRQRLEGVK